MASEIKVNTIKDLGGNTVLTSNGSGTISGLPASAISSGTVATARLGSGTASSSTFLAGDSSYKTVTGTITAFTNGVNNRVVTATSGTALNGEANLEFDGTDFKVLGKEFIGVVGSGGATTGKQTISFGSGEAMPQTLTAANSYIALGNNEYGDTSSYNGKVMIAFGYTEGASLTHAPAYFGYHEELNSGKTKGALTFYTRSATTDSAPTERMRVSSGGQVSIGTTETAYSNLTQADDNGIILTDESASIFATNTDVPLVVARSNGDSASRDCVIFSRGGSTCGTISATPSATSYNTSSDYRLKENVDYDFDATLRLKQLKPARFNFKADANKKVDGFIAHEVSSVIPEAISGEKDDMTPEVLYTADDLETQGDTPSKEIGDIKKVAKPIYQGIDQSKLVPLLTKALQEAITKIEILETKVTALENA